MLREFYGMMESDGYNFQHLHSLETGVAQPTKTTSNQLGRSLRRTRELWSQGAGMLLDVQEKLAQGYYEGGFSRFRKSVN